MGCEGLKSIVIPGSVSYIGAGAFRETGLYSVVFEQSDKRLDIGSVILNQVTKKVGTVLFIYAPVRNLSVGRRFEIEDIP